MDKGIPKPRKLKEKMKEVSLGKDENGYFVYTHRCRSKSYPSPEKIPNKDIKFIASTGSVMLSMRTGITNDIPLSIRAQDPVLQTAESMLKIITFLMFRVPVDSKKNMLSRVRGKIQRISPADVSMKTMPMSAAIGQAIGITKNVLAGLNPFFIKRVLDEMARLIHAMPSGHHMPSISKPLAPQRWR
jgi:hypothetical protein